MSRAASRFEETTTAIEDLFRLSPAPDRDELEQNARTAKQQALKKNGIDAQVEYILDSRAVQQLFASLPDSQFVSPKVVAAYCDCSTLTLERRLKAKHARVKDGEAEGWKKVLRAPPPQCDARGYLRWSFVRQFAHAWDLERNAPKAPYSKKLKPVARLMAALHRRFRFLKHKDGSIETAWGQGGVTVGQLVAILEGGGRLLHLTAVEALSLPWANPAARRPWEKTVNGALQELAVAVAYGQAQTSARALEALAGNPPPGKVRRGP